MLFYIDEYNLELDLTTGGWKALAENPTISCEFERFFGIPWLPEEEPGFPVIRRLKHASKKLSQQVKAFDRDRSERMKNY